ncbi:hypothetical protein QD46_18275 [Paenibacillus polymyxa]|uniref:hypothetical protein n=1 Tax=Paenibacillus polymyxa TaxID=1406 RepID=UPI0005CE2A30|nr:hypothetical protein [Paenibacillus polymyxa]KJD38609.1 hypothetical protein QD46_18275 [Paenibacillus polymyxa]
MLLILQAIIIEILRFVTAIGVFFTWMWIAAFLKMKVERGIKWIGNQIRETLIPYIKNARNYEKAVDIKERV